LSEDVGLRYESVNTPKLHRKLVRERQGVTYSQEFGGFMGWMRKLAASMAGVVTAMAALGVAPAYAIVNGVNAAPGEFPHMAGLVDASSPTVFCGGTLISDRYVLTAAGCLRSRQASNLVVLLGDHDYKSGTDTGNAAVYGVKRFVLHPSFNSTTQENDIALIELVKPVTFNAGVSPALLPPSNLLFTNSVVEVTGWGTTSFAGPVSTTLQKVQTTVVSNAQCATYYGDGAIKNSQICTWMQNKGSCSQDTGGPLTIQLNQKAYVVGVVSYGKGCATQTPDVNTRVTSYIPWIQMITRGLY
jgi:secreted trypsin-like serine protease